MEEGDARGGVRGVERVDERQRLRQVELLLEVDRRLGAAAHQVGHDSPHRGHVGGKCPIGATKEWHSGFGI